MNRTDHKKADSRIGVLFVCLGNICRSPAAEGTFAHLVRKRALAGAFAIDSCGTAAYHIGERANATTRLVADRHGIELPSRARQFQKSDFDRFDYIFAMDRSNYSDVCSLARSDEDTRRVWLFRSFDPDSGAGRFGSTRTPPDYPDPQTLRDVPDVPDPYYGGQDGFEEVQQIMLRTARNLLDWMIERHTL